MKTRDACASCGHKLRTILDLGSTPLANNYPLPGEPDGPSHPLQLRVCGVCWLVQQASVPEPADMFGSDYGFTTASPAADAYYGAVAEWCVSRSAPGLAVDIGSNDGTLQSVIGQYGRRTVGVEPSAAADKAELQGLTVVRDFFTREAAQKITAEHGYATLVTAFHVAAHVPAPDDFIAGIAALLADGGIAVVEFQSLADLITGGTFDLVYHEHQFHYSLKVFDMLAGSHGMRIREAKHTAAQGGSWRVVLAKADMPSLQAEGCMETERWLRAPSAYGAMQGRAEHARVRLLDVLSDEVEAGNTLAGYAAAAKATTLLNFCRIGPELVPYVTDTTPGKQGREIPGVRIPIRAEDPQDRADTLLLLASNHLPTVLRRLYLWRALGGRIVIPLPLPAVI